MGDACFVGGGKFRGLTHKMGIQKRNQLTNSGKM